MDEIAQIVQDLVAGAEKKLEYLKEKAAIKTKNEILPDLSKLNLAYKDQFLTVPIYELGKVLHFTEGYLIILASPRAPLIELDTKVCLESGQVIGAIDDIIGSVEHPHYSVLAYTRLDPDTLVYYPMNASILASVSHKRGTDASNNNDEETSEESSEDNFDKPNRKRKTSFKIFDQPPPFE